MKYMIREPLETIGERVAALRRYWGMNQAELCERLERETRPPGPVGISYISKVETGVTTPSGERAAAIARILQTTTDYLWGNTDNPNIPNETPTMFSDEAEEAGKLIDAMQPEQRRAALRMLQQAQRDYQRQAELDREIREVLALVEARGGTDLLTKIQRLLLMRAPMASDSGIGEMKNRERADNGL